MALQSAASMTLRESELDRRIWEAKDPHGLCQYKIMIDKTDGGYCVGEVEIEPLAHVNGGVNLTTKDEQEAGLLKMQKHLSEFMDRYWAFSGRGQQVTGKLESFLKQI